MNSIAPSIFGRIFFKSVLITVNDKGLVVKNRKTIQHFQWNELTSPLHFEFGFLGLKVEFSTAVKRYQFSMMSYHSEHYFKARSQQYWVNANEHRLDTLLNKIALHVNQRFLRQSSIENIKQLAEKEHARWFPWLKFSQATSSAENISSLQQKGQLLTQYALWNNKVTECFQEQYIKKQLINHQHFFDNVESNPLTEKQRRACIVDDDNNLLLAGAGTGKTSVMVGRAGYLVESKQATYQDILLLAYGRQAAKEMDDRIQNKLSTNHIKASTFHSLGLNIIAQVEGRKPRLSVFTENENAKKTWVQNCFVSLIKNQPEYQKVALDYFSQHFYHEKNQSEFSTLGDYYQYLQNNNIRSLQNDKVKNFGELHIANWLFYHGIDYQYDTPYQENVKTDDSKPYKPSFYLPKYNVYIECFIHDNAGNTAPYIDNQAYHKAIEWKKNTHKQNNTSCIMLTYAEYQQGGLLTELHKQLTALDVPFQQLSIDLILQRLTESGQLNTLSALLTQLIGMYKSACLNKNSELHIIKNEQGNQQIIKALALLKPIRVSYNNYLTEQGEIDFEDMIVKAIHYVESGQFTSPWRYLMVDEFQDISEPRARLVKALRNSKKGSSVFAVGDDWQAIYRFSGADIRLTTEFEQYFGFTTQTQLDLTFRFNNKIGQVATTFISKNPTQLTKNIQSITQVTEPAISIVLREAPVKLMNTDKQDAIPEILNSALTDVLQALQLRQAKTNKVATVLILARNWFQLPNSSVVENISGSYSLLSLTTQTFHASKGKEADFVVIIGLGEGKHGFPTNKATTPIIEGLLPPKEGYLYAEERRLFYVALTRAKHKVYLIADINNASCFVDELIAEHDIELNELNNNPQTDSMEVNCTTCETGTLKKVSGQYGMFYTCSLFPRCDHKASACTQCSSPMTSSQHKGFNECVNNECRKISPTCDKCDAEMVLRKSDKGEFWGCSNYRGNDELSCKNSKNVNSIQWPE